MNKKRIMIITAITLVIIIAICLVIKIKTDSNEKDLEIFESNLQRLSDDELNNKLCDYLKNEKIENMKSKNNDKNLDNYYSIYCAETLGSKQSENEIDFYAIVAGVNMTISEYTQDEIVNTEDLETITAVYKVSFIDNEIKEYEKIDVNEKHENDEEVKEFIRNEEIFEKYKNNDFITLSDKMRTKINEAYNDFRNKNSETSKNEEISKGNNDIPKIEKNTESKNNESSNVSNNSQQAEKSEEEKLKSKMLQYSGTSEYFSYFKGLVNGNDLAVAFGNGNYWFLDSKNNHGKCTIIPNGSTIQDIDSMWNENVNSAVGFFRDAPLELNIVYIYENKYEVYSFTMKNKQFISNGVKTVKNFNELNF